MNELVENLQLSQPSIRNMVRTLQEKQLIQEVGNDLSSGGRCPTRFALNEKNYLILCLYVQVDKVIYQLRNFNEIKKEPSDRGSLMTSLSNGSVSIFLNYRPYKKKCKYLFYFLLISQQ